MAFDAMRQLFKVNLLSVRTKYDCSSVSSYRTFSRPTTPMDATNASCSSAPVHVGHAAGPFSIRGRACRRQSQDGSIAVMAAPCLILMLAFCGLALDIGQIYNRKMELQNVADAAALAAASQLNGTSQGVTRALSKARLVVEEGRATLRVKYNSEKLTWSDSAISFGRTPGLGDSWSDAGSAPTTASDLLYAKVDTGRLGSSYGHVNTLFMHVLAPELAETFVSAVSVAGRSSTRVTPMAVCAMSSSARAPRSNPARGGQPANIELVEYGFRRGVSYDLMQLNPNGTSAEHFIVDPVTPPGLTGSAANVATTAIAPFVCSGSMAIGSVQGAEITVFPTFPLRDLYRAFNSRFGDYTGGLCTSNGAPPDFNVKSYEYASVGWMSTTRAGQAARTYSDAGKLETVADPATPPSSATAAAYGPLWAYARAVPFSAYIPGEAEPPAGYTPFGHAAWATLYGPGTPVASGYPSGTSTPYAASGGANFLSAPESHRPGVRHRRVINIPLLECPVTGARARVAGIGRFFLTVPATPSALFAEFAGLASESSLAGQVELQK